MWNKIKSVAPDTWARTICLLLAFINQILAITGKDMLPFTENEVYQIVSLLATLVTGGVAWWKNNSFTEAAQMGDAYIAAIRSAEVSEDDGSDI